MATEEQVAAAVMTALTALQAHPLTLTQAQANPPALYTEVVSVRRFGGVQRGSGVRSGQMYRVLLRQVAQVEVNAQRLRAKSAGLENTTLTVAGQISTPVEFETAQPIGPDDGWYSGAEYWTFALI